MIRSTSSSNNNMAQLDLKHSRSLDEIARRGSLPLKKRRFLPIESNPASVLLTRQQQQDQPDSVCCLPLTSLYDAATDSNDETMAAAWALVAAASSSSSSSLACLSRLPASTGLLVSLPPSISPQLQQQQQQQQIREELDGEESSFMSVVESAEAEKDVSYHKCQRLAHRDHTDYQRQLYQNGKEHHQQRHKQQLVATTKSAVASNALLSPTAAATLHAPTMTIMHSPMLLSTTRQDKRFTNAVGQVRCAATTTRGKACAYQCTKQGSSYCHMHADYGKNPPPRRSNNNNNKLGQDQNKKRTASSQVSVSPSLLSSSSSSLVSAEPSRQQQRPTSHASMTAATAHKTTMCRRTASAKQLRAAAKHAAGAQEMSSQPPLLLLSRLATTQWHNQTVRVATGPMVGRRGRVVKWGNGWVTIAIENVGMHNRRSFELYLISETDDDDDDDDAKATNVAPRSEDAAATTEDDQGQLLARCVSRDAVSPLPPVSVASGKGEDMKGLPSGVVEVVPDTPRPDYVQLDLSEMQSPTPCRGNRFEADTLNAPKVTPLMIERPSKAVNERTLVESLLLAEEGSRMDMLFGTAALERGRRNAHRPARYEDMAMLGKKRGHKVSLEPDMEFDSRPCEKDATML